jgi:VWFA-related protein
MEAVLSKSTLLGLAVVMLGSLVNAWSQQSTSPTTQTMVRASQSLQPNAPDDHSSAISQSVPDTTLTANTRLVQLDVVVTDHRGNSVADLKKEDFTILEDGQPQQIASFSFQQSKPVDARTPPSQPPPLPRGVYSNRITAVPSRSAMTVILLDALNTPVTDEIYARNQVLRYLQTHQGGESTAIYALTSRLLLLQSFTSDPELLRNSSEKKLPQQSQVLNEQTQNGDILGPDELVASLDKFEREGLAPRDGLRAHITLDAMNAIARSLSAYPGRKNLIWVSASFPVVNVFTGDLPSFFDQTWVTQEFQRTATLLTDSQISVYPVDARGLAPAMMDAQSTGKALNGRLKTGAQFGRDLTNFSFALSGSFEAMNQIASSTGGKAYYNRNDLDQAIALSIADGSTYYTVAYYPSNKDWDGKFRKVDVKVDRAGTSTHYRHGYVATDPMALAHRSREATIKEIATALGDPLPSTMITIFGQAYKLPSGAKVRNLTTTPSTTIVLQSSGDKKAHPRLAERQEIGVRFVVDTSEVTLLKRGNEQHLSLDFAIAAFGGDKVVRQTIQTLEGDPTPATVDRMRKDGGMVFNTSVSVPRGKNYRLRLLVHDNQSGKIGTVDIPIDDKTPTLKQ